MVQDIFVSGLGGLSGFEELSGSVELSGLEDIMEKPQEEEEAEAIEYSSNETAGTSLGDLLSRFKL